MMHLGKAGPAIANFEDEDPHPGMPTSQKSRSLQINSFPDLSEWM